MRDDLRFHAAPQVDRVQVVVLCCIQKLKESGLKLSRAHSHVRRAGGNHRFQKLRDKLVLRSAVSIQETRNRAEMWQEISHHV